MTTTETVKLARQKVRDEILRSAAILRPQELAVSVDAVLEHALLPAGGEVAEDAWAIAKRAAPGAPRYHRAIAEAIMAERAPNPAPSGEAPTEIRDLLHDLHSIIVVAKGEWTKQSAWSDWDQSVYERLLSVQAALANLTPNQGGEVEPVAWRKPKHPEAVEPFFIDAEARTAEWMKSIFTVPMYAAPATPAPSGEAVPVAWRYRVSPNQLNWNYWTDASPPTDPLGVAVSEPLFAAAPPSPQGVEVTEAMIDAALPHLIGTSSKTARPFGRFWPGMTADESENANWRYYGRDRVKAALTAALSPNGRAE